MAAASSDYRISEAGWAHRLDRYVAVAAAIALTDQLLKRLVEGSLVAGQRVSLIPGVMDLDLVYNTGAAFSLGEGAGWVFVAIAAVLVVGMAVWVVREELPSSVVYSLACVAGGGIGNLIDRVTSGRVVDYLATSFIDFPVFNLADIAVTCGIVAVIVSWLVWDHSRVADAGGSDRD
ncbi:MAG: signal peptidase II [Atopobiaceae bacterium]|jgi:signal peptidase II|nr:signal peptidase II [Atopobiaceae bacterium]MCH4180954.1 signal peptidase II [Atopobiaceae bacterium]MCH4214036.1 signal peptidase II [Atopobiaceae bacterium]MCH4276850.1 signal peptidase II [Atopobiaceae bacterium]MCI1227300.1 signal peptidase II [Atopobiaceae bacterium]